MKDFEEIEQVDDKSTTQTGKKGGVRKDEKLYNYIVDSYKASKEVITERNIYRNARKYTKLYENKAWDALGQHRAAHLTKFEIAVAFDAIETGVNIVTARIPRPDILPEFDANFEPYVQLKDAFAAAKQAGDMEKVDVVLDAYQELKTKTSDYASKLQRELVQQWKKMKMQGIMRMLYREKAKTGTAFLKTVFDPKTKKIMSTICDLTTIFPHPDCSSIEDHIVEPFIYAPVLSLERVAHLYNIPKEQIDEGAIVESSDILTQHEDTDTGASASLWAAVKRMFAGKKKKQKYCIVLECYIPANSSDYEEYLDSDPVETEDGNFKYDAEQQPVKKEIKRKRTKFPSGYKRVTVILNHKDMIIEEQDNPYKRPPIYDLRNFAQAGDFWGISELQAVEELIMKLNVSASNVNDNLRATGNPKLIVTRDAQENGIDGKPQQITNDPGGIIIANNPQGIGYVSPPQIGFDVKWWLNDFLKSWIDRILHISDALRGFNEFSQDSGRKVQALRSAAMGLFQTKVDEQAEFLSDIYNQWTFIYQTLWNSGPIVQKIEDDFGDAKFDEFDPAAGKDLTLFVSVSGESILPDDPFSKWEEALALYDRGMQRSGIPLISPEHLIDLAPTLDDKARAKRYLAKEQKKTDHETQLVEAMKAMAQLAEQASIYSDTMPGSQEEDEVTMQIFEIVQQFPEILGSPEFIALTPRIKLAVAAAIVLKQQPMLGGAPQQPAQGQPQPAPVQTQAMPAEVTA